MNAQQTDASGGSLDTIVIGGGQAGLALGYYLSRQHRNFVILDAHPRVGDAWRQRWDSLRLFTPAKFDGLPGMPFPGDRLAFPTKDEQADYLRSYADHFALPVRTGVRVDRLFRDGDRYVVTAAERRWEASRVVVATGGCQAPDVPAFADLLAPSVRRMRYVPPVGLEDAFYAHQQSSRWLSEPFETVLPVQKHTKTPEPRGSGVSDVLRRHNSVRRGT